MERTVAECLADHFASIEFKTIPENHISDATTLVLDYLGVGLAGSRTDSGQIAARFATATGGAAEAMLVGGKGVKVPGVHASFANAIASHSIELDDVDTLALFHFSPPVVSAALAAAEMVGASGSEFIAAVVAGCDMMARASEAMNPSLRNRGFHTTPTCGVFGAAVAAAKLLKLDRDGFVSALGLAGAQSSGLMEMYGPSMQKRFNPGPAARNGVVSAVMAKLGFTGAATIFEGERGFCRAFSDHYDLEKLTSNLGTEYPIDIEYKPYSCARPIHNAIDCALNVRRELKTGVDMIRAIRVRRHPAWANYHLNARPQTYHEAQVSLQYSVAVALIEGAALLPQYRNEKLSDATVLRISQMIEVTSDDSLPRGVSCHLTVVTADGATYTSQVDYPRGSIANPMSADEMASKVHMLADEVIGKSAVERVIETVRGITRVKRIGDVMKLAQMA